MDVKEELRHIFNPEEAEDDFNLAAMEERLRQFNEEERERRFHKLHEGLGGYFFAADDFDDLLERIDEAKKCFKEVRNAAIIRMYEMEHC